MYSGETYFISERLLMRHSDHKRRVCFVRSKVKARRVGGSTHQIQKYKQDVISLLKWHPPWHSFKQKAKLRPTVSSYLNT
ncbi:hypothetical protein AgCh_024164 [Apium graveolens]